MSYMQAEELEGWRENNSYPLMFTTMKNGKQRLWACWVVGNIVYRTDGYIDGKLKTPQEHEYTGNTLRTGEEQSPLEAEKMWLKQFDHGYRPLKSDKYGQKIAKHVQAQKEQNGGMNRGVRMFGETEITTKSTAGKQTLDKRHCPMLAKKYKDYNRSGEFGLTSVGNAIKFPALVQAKVDGLRVLPRVEGEEVILESRSGKTYRFLDHIREEIKYWLKLKNSQDIILDGELYVHILYRDEDGDPTYSETGDEMSGVERFQFLSEACKITRNEPHDNEEMVEFWIFDIWDPTKTNKERFDLLQELFADYDGDIIKIVPSTLVNTHGEIEDFMQDIIGETDGRVGYEFEGVMVRQLDAKYEARNNYHSSCLLKYKRFEDEEWEIVGAEKCTGGVQDGAIVWHCEKEINGRTKRLSAKQMGDTKSSQKLLSDFNRNPKRFIGKFINIRFNERSKDGIPRFPRATSIVEDK